jgi:hypothetical protein
VEEELKVPKEEQWAWDHYDPVALRDADSDAEGRSLPPAKQKKVRKLFNILVVVDDFADDPAFSRRDALLHSLFTRGRHAFISTICATQKFRALSNIIRVNATALIIFRLAVRGRAAGHRGGDLGRVRQGHAHRASIRHGHRKALQLPVL